MAKKNKKQTKGASDFAAFMAKVNADETIANLSEREEKFYKFGDYNLDRALYGGLPAGQVYAFQGAPSSGKSLAALTISKQVIDDEDENSRVAYIDTEDKISRKALSMMGLLNNGKFLHMSMTNLEEVIDKITEFAESGYFKLIVIDSLDSLTTDEQEERETHAGSKVGGYKAKVLSDNLPKVVHAAAMNECAVLFVQQIRKDPGAMFSNPVVTSGGEAIKHAVTIRLNFSPNKDGNAEEDGKLAYQGAKVQIMKTNQGALPKDKIPIRFYIGDNHPWGIDPVNSIVDEAIRLKVFALTSPTGHSYRVCDELCDAMGTQRDETINGRNNILKSVTSDPVLQEEVRKLVDERLEAEANGELDSIVSKSADNIDQDDDIVTDFEELQ